MYTLHPAPDAQIYWIKYRRCCALHCYLKSWQRSCSFEKNEHQNSVSTPQTCLPREIPHHLLLLLEINEVHLRHSI